MRALLVSLTAGGLLAAGLAAPAEAAPAATGDVQVVTPADINRLHHTIRHADGTWQAWGTTDPLGADEPEQLASVMINGVDHIVYYATTVHMPPSFHPYQALRDSTGNWGNDTLPTGDFFEAAVANLDGHLALVAKSSPTELRLSVQQGDGSWSAWETVPTGGYELGAIAVTANGGVLRVLVSGLNDTRVADYDRAPNGAWSQPNTVTVNGPGAVIQLQATQVGGDLQVTAVGQGGPGQLRVVHGIRRADGTWTTFGDVLNAAGAIANVREISATNSRGELQLAVTTSDGKLWHTIRHANGTWQHFGDVMAAAGPGYALDVAIAGE
ncbi:hypothetical protein [Kutzneria sp. NPDC051319]|uniref:hypothetical protein n=1 Tax=Kutzneria sp. NPDC051319 TaxID=3155047 RepID=UPI003437C76D